MKTQHCMHWINGEWTTSGDERTRHNPHDARQPVFTVGMGGTDLVCQAIESAQSAQVAWAKTPRPERAALMLRVAQKVAERMEEIADAMVCEAGKLPGGAVGEANKTIAILRHFAGAGSFPVGQVVPAMSADSNTYTTRCPVGVAGLLTPYNFPWAVAAWKIAPALIEGNGIVWKPNPLVPKSSCLIAEIFHDAGLPPGLLNLVHGDVEAGEAIVSDPRIGAISFTGSTDIGLKVYANAALRGLSKITCEMGGNNAIVVMDDADLDLAAIAIVSAAFGYAGQRCTAARRVIAHSDIIDYLIDRVVTKAKEIQVGRATTSTMGPLISRAHLERVLGVVTAAKEAGAHLIHGGEQVMDGGLEHGHFMQPTIFTGVDRDSELFQKETFGPVLCFTLADDLDHAIALHNGTRYGHTGSIYSEDRRTLRRFELEAEIAMVHRNEPPTGGDPQLPFRGMGASGIGPGEMGTDGLDFFCEIKAVYDNCGRAGAVAAGR